MKRPTEHPWYDRWLVYLLGSTVFAAILYFCLRRFFGATAGIALALSIPVGIVAFIIFAKVSESFESHPGDWDNTG